MRPLIFSYWSNVGEGAEPAENTLVELCLQSIERNAGCEFVLLRPENVHAFVPDFDPRWLGLRPAHQADLVRLRALASWGGMWLDADTIVQRSLAPLFDLLETEGLDCVGCDWRPVNLPDQHQAYAVGIMGPMKPHQAFIETAIQRQKDVLGRAADWLANPERSLYPLGWEDLLSQLISSTFTTQPPRRTRIFPGAATWLGLTGSELWAGGDIANALDPVAGREKEVAQLRRLPLVGLSNSLYPSTFTSRPAAEIVASGTIVGALIGSALSSSI
jgi:hypothetical protein